MDLANPAMTPRLPPELIASVVAHVPSTIEEHIRDHGTGGIVDEVQRLEVGNSASGHVAVAIPVATHHIGDPGVGFHDLAEIGDDEQRLSAVPDEDDGSIDSEYLESSLVRKVLIRLSTISESFRVAAEGLLWQNLVLTYDVESEEDIEKWKYVARRVGRHVLSLSLDCDNGEAVISPASADILHDALLSTFNIRTLALYTIHLPNVLGNILSRIPHGHYASLRKIQHHGFAAPGIYNFLHTCPKLTALSISCNIEPNAAATYAILSEPWDRLRELSGNLLHTSHILRAPTSPQTLEDVTIHLKPGAESFVRRFDPLPPPLLNVRSFGFGDISFYPPLFYRQIRDDLIAALKIFPNLTHLRRVPFNFPANDSKGLARNDLFSIDFPQSIEYISLMDFSLPIRDNIYGLVLKLKRGPLPRLKELVRIPCPRRTAEGIVRFELDSEGWTVEEFEVDSQTVV